MNGKQKSLKIKFKTGLNLHNKSCDEQTNLSYPFILCMKKTTKQQALRQIQILSSISSLTSFLSWEFFKSFLITKFH